MGTSQSVEPPPPNKDLGRKFQVDEFRRGDRVLVFSRLEQLGDPALVEKLRANPLSTSATIPSSPVGGGSTAASPIGTADQTESSPSSPTVADQRQEVVAADSAVVEVRGAEGDDVAEEEPIKKRQGSNGSVGSQSAELPDYPRSVYGWVVLAHDYVGGVYAVQMADGSYIPSLVAEKDFELLIQCDWTRGGIDGDKYPDSVPLSSLELPVSLQNGGASSTTSGGGSPPGQTTPVGAASPAQSTSGGGSTLGTINTKTASKSAKNAAELKKKKMLCGTRVSATLRAGKYSGIIVCINSDGTFNVQADFGDYLTRIKLEQVESLEPQ